jgi:hypothetical protein
MQWARELADLIGDKLKEHYRFLLRRRHVDQ